MRLVVALVFAWCAGVACLMGSPRANAVAAASSSTGIAVACDSRLPSPAFAVTETGVLLPATLANAALDISTPLVAVTCSAVITDPSLSTPFDPGPGVATMQISGPGIVVESAGQEFTAACGDAGQGAPCQGAVLDTANATAVTAPPALTFHVALLPRAVLPEPVAAGAIGVRATFRSRVDGAEAMATAAIDLAPPSYALTLTPDRAVAGGLTAGADSGAVIGAQLAHLLPGRCAVLGAGPYMACQTAPSGPGEPSAEAGSIQFATDLGSFINGGQQITVACGDAPSRGGLQLPAPGVERSVAQSCTGAGVRLLTAGQAGEATVTATFTGALTGAVAQQSATLTFAPAPPALQLSGGCTAVNTPRDLPPGASARLVAESVAPATAVSSLWRRDAASDKWQAGYYRDAGAPLDFTTLEPGEPISICVDALARFPLS